MLRNEIDKTKSQLLETSKIIEIYNYYADVFKTVVGTNNDTSNLNNIVNINIREMFQKLDIDSSELVSKLEGFQKIVNNLYYPLSDEQKNECIKIFENLNEIILEKLNSKLTEEKELTKNLSLLESIVVKLENNNLDKESYDFLCELLKRDDVVIENKMDLLIALALMLNSFVDTIEVEEEIDEVSITNLDLNKVIELFNKYGYDFNNFSNETTDLSPKFDSVKISPRDYILKLGNYDNLEAILKVFKENDINIDFNKYGNQLCMIFVLSNSNIVLDIINNIKKDIYATETKGKDTLDLNVILAKFIKNPSLFIKGKKHYSEKQKPSNKINVPPSDNLPPIGDDSSIVHGNYDNYCANRELFISLGVDIIASLKKCICVFGFSNKTIKRNIETLETYGIKKEQYVKSLSCLSSATCNLEYITFFEYI